MDESGDLGFDFSKQGTSRYFVLTMLKTENYKLVFQAVERTLKSKLRKKKKHRYVTELKGNNTNPNIKKYFLNQLSNHQHWHLHTIILDKKRYLRHRKTINTERLYDQMTIQLLKQITRMHPNKEIQIIVDRRKRGSALTLFNHALQNSIIEITDIEHVASEANHGIQAVDLFCYGILRKYEANDSCWYEQFCDHIQQEITI